MKKSIKFWLVSLLVWFIWLIWFWYCDTITVLSWSATNVATAWSINFETWYCIQMNNTSTCPWYARFYNNNGDLIRSWINWEYLYCFDFAWYYNNTRTNSSCSIYIYESPFYWNNQECPAVDTWSILSWYCDINYCVENWLCPVASWSRSELKINDIVHQSAPFINITIPYEYTWDYTVDENEFDLVVSWYNVDYEYIDWIIRTQQSKPNQTDFNNIVSGLIPLLIPWLVIILFLYFVFRFIKKIF